MKKKIKPKLYKFEIDHPLEETEIVYGVSPKDALRNHALEYYKGRVHEIDLTFRSDLEALYYNVYHEDHYYTTFKVKLVDEKRH